MDGRMVYVIFPVAGTPKSKKRKQNQLNFLHCWDFEIAQNLENGNNWKSFVLMVGTRKETATEEDKKQENITSNQGPGAPQT